MTNSNTGGSAFPSEYDGDCQYQGNKGMTLLDYFAGQALMSFTSEEICKDDLGVKQIAEMCYEQADAMIAEKHRREGKDGKDN